MIPRTNFARFGLKAAACLGVAFLSASVLSSAAFAQEAECATAAPNGKPFGKRFGKLLGSAGLSAITGRKAAARAAADAALRDVADSAKETAVAEVKSAACRKANEGTPNSVEAEVDAATPREKARSGSYARPGLMPIAAEIKDRKRAFDEFGKVRCSSCEGGYSYDSWANHFFHSELRGEPNGWAKKLAAMQVGEELNWQGNESYGTIAMRSQEQVNGFDCKTYSWSLEKGASSAQRDGLICWGKASDFSASDSWVEVY